MIHNMLFVCIRRFVFIRKRNEQKSNRKTVKITTECTPFLILPPASLIMYEGWIELLNPLIIKIIHDDLEKVNTFCPIEF